MSALPAPASAARITKAKIDPEGWKDGQRSTSTGIGGSDIAKILGLHPTRTAFDCFVEKIGILDPPKVDLAERNARVRWGALLEPVILNVYEEDMGIPIDRLGKVMFRSVERPWEQVSPDALAIHEPRGVEVKTAGLDQVKKWGAAGTDDAPEHYYLQAAWAMMITECETWDMPVLIGGNDFRIYSITRDRKLEAIMREKAEQFWTMHVQTGTPPDPVEGTLVAAYVRKKYPTHLIAARAATPKEVQAIQEIVMLKRQMAALAEREEKLTTTLKLAIGDAAGLDSERAKVIWKQNRASTVIDWEGVARRLAAKMPKAKWQAALQPFTTIKPGARPFLARLIGEED